VTLYYRDGYHGQVAETYSIQVPKALWPPESIETEFINLTKSGFLVIKIGYAWDFASGPTLDFRNFPGYKKTRVPSLVHDSFCQLIRQGHMSGVKNARKHADRYFYDLLIARKFWKFRAQYWYRGVRLGAKIDQKPKPIL
jgi:hypothetical protein